ncbi:putative nuclease HARBI1 [Pleurodeles waltl]|uniref:putative nuclease HARBI1 n=1 Tax=Pleurodeles waltl TaxID=8319 RepID=UPI0037093D1C
MERVDSLASENESLSKEEDKMDTSIDKGKKEKDQRKPTTNRKEEKMSTGDSGYPNCPYLLTTVRYPTTSGEVRFNKAHGRTSPVVEQTFGCLHARFHNLNKSGGALLYSPKKAEVMERSNGPAEEVWVVPGSSRSRD